MRVRWNGLLCALLLAVGWTACAQNTADGDGTEPVHTLRVFANLVQVPTLVLDAHDNPVDEKGVGKFMVSLDDGRKFPATHVRLEGEDPISLAILLDASGKQDELMKVAAQAFATLLPGLSKTGGLRQRDHLSVYAMDCTVMRAAEDVPADQVKLEEAVRTVLAQKSLHGATASGHCADKLKVWDTVFYLAYRLSQVPGRRVILAVTSGEDHLSQHRWRETLDALHHDGVAMFGVEALPSKLDGLSGGARRLQVASEDVFGTLCQSSGGWVLLTEPAHLSDALDTVVTMVRARYIVQFPRGNSWTGGKHHIEVTTTARVHYKIRTAGLSVPLADPDVLADPNVLANDPGNAPELGKHKVLPPK